MKQKAQRIVSICPDLSGNSVFTKLFLQIESALCKAAFDEGVEYVVIGGSQPPTATIGGSPIFACDLPPTSLSLDSSDWIDFWSSKDSRIFSNELMRVYRSVCETKGEEEATAFLLYHAHPCHLSSLIEFGLAHSGRFPIVINLYWLHFMYGPNRPRRVPWLRDFLQATRSLRSAANVHIRVDSKRLADRIFEDTGEQFDVLPFFSPMAASRIERKAKCEKAAFKIAYPTAVPSREKGYDLVIGLAERLQDRDVEIIARASDAPTTEICLPTIRALEGGLKLLNAFMPEADYQTMLAASDLVLVPYASWQFESRTSGIVADAISAGVPLVGPRDTWVGDQIEQSGAGRTFVNGELDELVSAVENIMDNYSQHLRDMNANSPAWLELNNANSLIRYLVRCTDPRNPAAHGSTAMNYNFLKLHAVARVLLPFRRGIQARVLRRLNALRQVAAGRRGSLTTELVRTVSNKRPMSKIPSIRWDTQGIEKVELRLDACDGMLIARGGKRGAVWSTSWIKPQSRIFLQDATDGRPPVPQHTLDSCHFRTTLNSAESVKSKRGTVLWLKLVRLLRKRRGLGIGNLTLVLPSHWSGTASRARVSWSQSGRPTQFELRTDGRVITRHDGPGAVEIPKWVVKGTVFDLFDAGADVPDHLRHLDMVIATRTKFDGSGGFLRRRENILLSLVRLLRKWRGLGVGRIALVLPSHWSGSPSEAKLSWSQSGRTTQFELRTDGRVIARHDGPGSIELPKWVVDGMVFDLFDVGADVPRHLKHLDRVTATQARFGGSGSFLRPRENILSEEQEEADEIAPPNVLRFNVEAGEWAFVVPPSTGEVYLLAAHSKAFLEKYGGDRVVIFAPQHHLDILELFPDAPLRGETRATDDLGELLETRQAGSALRMDYGVGASFSDRRDQILHGRHRLKKASFAQLFLEELGLKLDSQMLTPTVNSSLEKRAAEKFAGLKLIAGTTVILAPVSNSSPPPGAHVWAQLAKVLLARGFVVVTNCGPKEQPLPGTIALSVSISELFAMSELGGLVVTGRNGLCEILSCAKTRLHILYQDYRLIAFPGIEIPVILAENGIADAAIYHKMGLDESDASFADRVLNHPDFASVNAPWTQEWI